MSEHWYENDWVICLSVCAAIMLTIVGNLYIHGGHIQW